MKYATVKGDIGGDDEGSFHLLRTFYNPGLVYMILSRVSQRIFLLCQCGDCKCRKLSQMTVQNGIYWLMWLWSVEGFQLLLIQRPYIYQNMVF